MVHFEKSMPAPDCLAVEKAKANGNYNCGQVLERIKNDFKNKCYICEYKEPESINIEHFRPHQGNPDLKFSWENLFFSCAHCNNIKLANYDNILDCSKSEDNVDTDLKYIFKPFPFEKVKIESLIDNDRVNTTRNLLMAVYNGTTMLKKLESANLRNSLLDDIMQFQKLLKDYFEISDDDNDGREYFRIKIRNELGKSSSFTAFKRWIIWDNEKLNEKFGGMI
jgi:uncharacterized protein (TIGR02646 family)